MKKGISRGIRCAAFLSFAAAAFLYGCGTSVAEKKESVNQVKSRKIDSLWNDDSHVIDDTTVTLLELLFNEYPMGGIFSGPPGVMPNGDVDKLVLSKDTAYINGKGRVEISYRYFDEQKKDSVYVSKMMHL